MNNKLNEVADNVSVTCGFSSQTEMKYILHILDLFINNVLPDTEKIINNTQTYDELKIAFLMNSKKQLRLLNQIKNTLLAEGERRR